MIVQVDLQFHFHVAQDELETTQYHISYTSSSYTLSSERTGHSL